jgi:microcystin-dependent protein
LSRTEFSLLFSRLGESWGVGDGSTTFNLPNLDKRFLAGFDSTDAAYDTVGESGGSATGAVSGTTGAGSAHSHTFSGTSDPESAHTHSFSGSAATVPPYKVVRYLIKVA